jgi:hypothetical protein
MDALAHRLSILSFGVIGLIVLVGVIQSRGLLEMFTVGGGFPFSFLFSTTGRMFNIDLPSHQS